MRNTCASKGFGAHSTRAVDDELLRGALRTQMRQLYVALENGEYVRRSSSLMTSMMSYGTHNGIPNISEKSKLDEKSH